MVNKSKHNKLIFKKTWHGAHRCIAFFTFKQTLETVIPVLHTTS